jgi:FKBP-type peptidyl-prolyl cis-trans isomerase FkpA
MKQTALLTVVLAVLAGAGCRKPQEPSPPAGAAAPATALKVDEVAVGNGPVATRGKVVQVHYTGYLPDGTRFDSTRDRKPLQFQLGQGTVLKGWDLGVEGMKVGGKRKLTIPPALAFGERAVGQIKPNSTLVFDIELVSVQ